MTDPIVTDETTTTPGAADAQVPDHAGTEPAPHPGLVEARDRYRGERDSAREQLATANAVIERLRRAAIEQIAGERLAMAGDLWLNGNGVDDYLDDDGNIDADRVRQDTALLLTERPGLQRPAAAVDPSQSLGNHTETKPSWSNLLQN